MGSLLVASPRVRRKKAKPAAGGGGQRQTLVRQKMADSKSSVLVLEAEELALHMEISAAVARDLGR